jgi:hypothetical protein
MKYFGRIPGRNSPAPTRNAIARKWNWSFFSQHAGPSARAVNMNLIKFGQGKDKPQECSF